MSGNPLLNALSAIRTPPVMGVSVGYDTLANALSGVPANLAGSLVDASYMMTMRPEEMAGIAMGMPNQRPELREFPGSSDWMGEKMGADVDSLPFLLSALISPDGTDVALPAAKLAASGKLDNLIQAMTVAHGTPHKWLPERLIKWGDGKTEWIVGEGDRLPDVPQGAEVVKDMPLGRPRMDKIGTGEGNQMFGHGIYVAEDPKVAGTYRFVDARIDPDVAKYNGMSMESLYNAAQRKQDRAHRLKDNAAIKKANAELKFWEDMMVRNHPDQVIQDVLSNADDWPELTNFVKSLDRSKFSGVEEAGHLYELDLPDETIGKMLDWDKPLSEQPESVRSGLNDAIRQLAANMGFDDITDPVAWASQNLDDPTGRGVYQAIAARAPSTADASEKLRRLGIPGIKYLDGTSRSAGEGTRNFVVFDESYITPLKRNGEALK